MKILFVSSGNRKQGLGLNPIIHLQAESLRKLGVEIDHFLIFGQGFFGYFKNIFLLRNYLKKNSFALIHAHFGFTCVVAQIAKGKLPLVVTLMGTDILGQKEKDGSISLKNRLVLWINRFFSNFIYQSVIVKSEKMNDILKNRKKNLYVIPNGVDMVLFQEVPKIEALAFLNWNPNLHHFIFVSNPKRTVKNFALAEEAVKILNNNGHNVKLHVVSQEKSENLKYYYSAASALLLTSFHEGSPNVVKEAMACNCPIVSTDVGDVAWLIQDVVGCYLTSFDGNEFANELNNCLEFGKNNSRTLGRNKLQKLGLSSENVASKIFIKYQQIIH